MSELALKFLSRASVGAITVGVAVFFAFAAIVLVPIGFFALTPFIAYVGFSAVYSLFTEKPREWELGSGRAKWNQVPLREKVERLTERLQTAAMIAHKESTQPSFSKPK